LLESIFRIIWNDYMFATLSHMTIGLTVLLMAAGGILQKALKPLDNIDHSLQNKFQSKEAFDSDVLKLLEQGMFVRVRRMLEDMEPEDIAHLLEASPPKGRLVLWQLTDPEDQGEILDELSEDVKDGIMVRMAPDQLAAATEDHRAVLPVVGFDIEGHV